MQVTTNYIAEVAIEINAGAAAVWHALTDSEQVSKYMFDAHVESDWKEGSLIIWRGNYNGKNFKDKGVIIQMKPEHLFQYTHYSPLSGFPDTPENYHIVTIEIFPESDHVLVKLSQDNNPSAESKTHSEKNWSRMLEELKKLVESEVKHKKD